MDSATARRLVDLNREFYQTFAGEFSATRQRLQPGVRQILSGIGGAEQILDLGCGNGEVARELSRAKFGGTYLGLDLSPDLLALARPGLDTTRYRFAAADLTIPGKWTATLPGDSSFDLVLCFATLHHIPSSRARLELARTVRTLLSRRPPSGGPGGRFVLSNWQFLNSDKLKARVQPWASVGIPDTDVDEGDYLLDWRGSGPQPGLRYVHHFSQVELTRLAEESEFDVRETFYSDGQGERLGLYQVWA
jgi:tRNA (uracil-5-)-methyltransferase TRM9